MDSKLPELLLHLTLAVRLPEPRKRIRGFDEYVGSRHGSSDPSTGKRDRTNLLPRYLVSRFGDEYLALIYAIVSGIPASKRKAYVDEHFPGLSDADTKLPTETQAKNRSIKVYSGTI